MSDSPLHPVLVPEEILLRDCTIRHERRRGPGGQHRNKTESAVVLHHTPSGIDGQAAERRSQHDNLRVAIKRLRLNLALLKSGLLNWQPLLRPIYGDLDAMTNESPATQNTMILRSLLAEALDVIADRNWHLPGAAVQLGITTSQLVKFLKKEPRALLLVNQHREQLGMRPME